MTLSRIAADDFPEVDIFLCQFEPTCVSLVEHFLHGYADMYALRDGRGIRGIFSYAKGGVVLHCLPYADDFAAFHDILREYFTERKIFCINGEETGSLFLIQLLTSTGTAPPVQINRYFLMARPCTGELHGTSGYRVCRCSEKDTDNLLPLEAGYLKEEVLPKGNVLNMAFCRMQLEKKLKTQFVFASRARLPPFRFVAKAGTNAIGRTCVQLGGVYTVPSCRRKGYGFNTVLAAVRFMDSLKKNTVLFVKESNRFAFGLYKKTGFAVTGRYIIAYY